MLFKKISPNKISVDKGSEFYNRSLKSWLDENEKKLYSTHNEGKSLVAERFTRIKFINTCLQYQKMCILIN